MVICIKTWYRLLSFPLVSCFLLGKPSTLTNHSHYLFAFLPNAVKVFGNFPVGHSFSKSWI